MNYKDTEKFEKKTNAILEMIAIGQPASKIYDAIALMYEKRHKGMRCSLLELEDGKLLHGGAPSMPKEYCEAVHGLEIGPNIGSCGTSTYTGKRVIVENIETDLKWKNIKAVALPHGMRCCWSEPIISSKGKVLGAFGMYYDYPCSPNDEESKDLYSAARLASIIMERDHLQRRISKDQKIISEQSKLVSMGEMIGNIAHQWRQPLSVITTVASGIKLELEHSSTTKEDIFNNMSEIIKQANYLSQTIDDFRMFSEKSEEKENLSLVDIIESTLSILDSSLKSSYIKVIKALDTDIKVLGLKNELTQSFINIINNAKDAIVENIVSDENRFIFIEIKQIGKKTILEIRDNGNGINENIINRIFEPYFTSKHKSIGTGIGLSMAHQIITNRHRGHIRVNNTEFRYKGKVYKGASFKVVFD